MSSAGPTSIPGATVTGIAVPYVTPTEIFIPGTSFWEQFVQGWCTAQLADGFRTIPATMDLHHDDGQGGAVTRNGSLRFTDTPQGLVYEADLLPADQWTVQAVDSGLVAPSIAFGQAVAQWTELPDGSVLRTVTSATLYAVSLVLTPAYGTTTARISRRSRPHPLSPPDADVFRARMDLLERQQRYDREVSKPRPEWDR